MDSSVRPFSIHHDYLKVSPYQMLCSLPWHEKMDKDFSDKQVKIDLLIDALKERFHLLAPTE